MVLSGVPRSSLGSGKDKEGQDIRPRGRGSAVWGCWAGVEGFSGPVFPGVSRTNIASSDNKKR